MMSYLSVEWRKTKKFSMLMIGIWFLGFCSLIVLGFTLVQLILWLQEVKRCLFYGDN